MNAKLQGHSARQHRLHALCPYFAMFPPKFVRDAVLAYTKPGDLIYDPFSGRGTTLLESLLLDRRAIASDINPVAYCISAAKAYIPRVQRLLSELKRLEEQYALRGHEVDDAINELPIFFTYAFHPATLGQLIFLRKTLDWRNNSMHRFLSALVLGHLHGETNRSDYYLSNQMPHSISTKPGYSVRYWRKHRLTAPYRDCFALLRNRLSFRLGMGVPAKHGRAMLCDVRNAAATFQGYSGNVKAIITSPPYLNVTNFEEDQWLRLWFLGGSPYPTYKRVSRDDRYGNAEHYWAFIRDAWQGVAPLLKRKAVLVCRIGAKCAPVHVLIHSFRSVVRDVWPNAAQVADPLQSPLKSSQMSLLNPEATGCRFEVDFVFALT